MKTLTSMNMEIELFKAFKARCEREDISMASVVERLLHEYMKDYTAPVAPDGNPN